MRAWLIAVPEKVLARFSAQLGDQPWLFTPPAALVSVPEPDWVIVRELVKRVEFFRLEDIPPERRTARNVVIGLVFLGPDRAPPDWTPADGPLYVHDQRWLMREAYFKQCVLALNRWVRIRRGTPSLIANPLTASLSNARSATGAAS